MNVDKLALETHLNALSDQIMFSCEFHTQIPLIKTF